LIKPAERPAKEGTMWKRVMGTMVGSFALKMAYYIPFTDATLSEALFTSAGIALVSGFVTDYLPEFRKHPKKRYISASLAIGAVIGTYSSHTDRLLTIPEKKDPLQKQEYKIDSFREDFVPLDTPLAVPKDSVAFTF
ncbi:MAG: hypothetical protein KC535_03050, partial [Nanoarchaeota archaeon]|nr:hypothetical protein [Nanoarchaeota archaeon]